MIDSKLNDCPSVIRNSNCTPVLNILGCKVDMHGVHANSDKMAKVRDWHVPSDHREVLHFLGLVEYLTCFMPNISAYTGLLQTICVMSVLPKRN